MQISQGTTIRAAPADRNPVQKVSDYQNNGLAPAGVTVRWTYTVTSAKKSVVQATDVWMQRQTVAAPVGLASSFLTYTPFGGGLVYLQIRQLITNGIGDSPPAAPSISGMQLGAGDVIDYRTSDASTGGTLAVHGNLAAMEYDA